MSVAEIIQLVRIRTNTTVNMMSDVDMLIYLNIYYYKLHAKIVNIDKNYFWFSWNSNLVQDQVEYTLLQADGATNTFGQYKIESVGVKWRDNQECYAKASMMDWDQFDVDSSCLEKGFFCDCGGGCGGSCLLQPIGGCSADTPIVIIAAQSIFVYPAPKVSVVDGLKLEGSQDWYTLEIADTSADILMVKGYHELISLGMMREIYRERNLLNEKNDAIQEYNAMEREMLRDITFRKTTPVVTRPNRLGIYS